jgi:hypothetical protein
MILIQQTQHQTRSSKVTSTLAIMEAISVVAVVLVQVGQ